MSVPARFDGLKKLSPEPAARILAGVGATLETPVAAPARALHRSPVNRTQRRLAHALLWKDDDVDAFALPAEPEARNGRHALAIESITSLTIAAIDALCL